MSSSSSLEIVSNFLTLLDGQKKYEEAGAFLVDDFQFLTPKDKFHSKSDWLQNFPKSHKDAPTFEDPMPGGNNKQVLQKGKKKVALMTFHMMETYELNDDGKIVKITAAKA
jgi:hypothetical protein